MLMAFLPAVVPRPHATVPSPAALLCLEAAG
jgi:hypothetical protein